MCLSAEDVLHLQKDISPLLPKSLADENAKKFDVMMHHIELAALLPEANNANRYRQKVMRIATLLQEKASIPQVLAKMDTINEVLSPAFWEEPSLPALERVRTELRDLVKMIVSGKGESFILNIGDEVIDGGEAEVFAPASYKQRITDYLANHKQIPVIQKIIRLEQLTQKDIQELEKVFWKELGTKEEYRQFVEKGRMLCGDSIAAFIRSQVGIDRNIALQKFSEFLSGHVLSSAQEEYLKTIITYVCKNGDITLSTIINEPPFDNYDWQQVFGEHLISVRDYVNTLHNSIVA